MCYSYPLQDLETPSRDRQRDYRAPPLLPRLHVLQIDVCSRACLAGSAFSDEL